MMMDNKKKWTQRRSDFVARELQRLNIDIAALQEMRIAEEDQLTEMGVVFTESTLQPSANRYK